MSKINGKNFWLSATEEWRDLLPEYLPQMHQEMVGEDRKKESAWNKWRKMGGSSNDLREGFKTTRNKYVTALRDEKQ